MLGWVAPVERYLNLCCGFGEIERILDRLDAFKECVGVDVAPGKLKAA